MFCPSCQAEYRTGFTHCNSCDVDLVLTLPFAHEELESHAAPVTVFVASHPGEASLMKSLLEGSGVEVFLINEHLARMDSPIALLIGGFRLAVHPAQEAQALEILRSYREGLGADPSFGSGPVFSAAQGGILEEEIEEVVEDPTRD